MTLPGMRRILFRGGTVTAAGGLMAALAMTAGAGAAFAGQETQAAGSTLKVSYPVKGSTFLATPNFTLALGPGKLTSKVNESTGNFTANLKLPDATGSFKESGVIPVTATAQFINDGPTTGSINLNTGAVQSTSRITLRIVSLQVGGVGVPVGPACETSTPATVPVTSQPGFNLLKGGNLSGTYTIPKFAHCGLATLLINITLPGSGNTITLTLGKAKVG
jgi:hypothetical protein